MPSLHFGQLLFNDNSQHLISNKVWTSNLIVSGLVSPKFLLRLKEYDSKYL